MAGVAGSVAGSSAAGGVSGASGATAGGGNAGGGLGGAGAAGTAGSSAGGGGGNVDEERCHEIEAEYAAEVAVQIECSPGASNVCRSEIEAVPGCDCLIPIEPKDPFAIENLLNIQNDWLTLDCASLACPDPCPSGTGRCQMASGSLGGRCVAGP